MMRDFIEAANESRAKGDVKKFIFQVRSRIYKTFIYQVIIKNLLKSKHQNSLMHACTKIHVLH